MMEIGLAHYLTVAAILFTLGVFGIFLNRKNVIIILMAIELPDPRSDRRPGLYTSANSGIVAST